jgi:hypothetical protein
MAFESQGARLYWSTSTGLSTSSTALVGGITGITGPNAANSEIDITDLQSTAKEFIPGLLDNGNLTFEGNFDPADPGQANMQIDQRARTKKKWVIAFNDASSYQIVGDGYITNFSPSIATDDKVSLSGTIRITGGVTGATA